MQAPWFSRVSRVPKSTGVTIAFVEFLDGFQLHLNDWQKDHLGNAVAGLDRE